MGGVATVGWREHGGRPRGRLGRALAHLLLSAPAKLFLRQGGGAGALQAALRPQNQLRQAAVRPAEVQSRTGGGYRRALPQEPQNGRPLKSVVQSRPPPPPPGSNWQVRRRPMVAVACRTGS